MINKVAYFNAAIEEVHFKGAFRPAPKQTENMF